MKTPAHRIGVDMRRPEFTLAEWEVVDDGIERAKVLEFKRGEHPSADIRAVVELLQGRELTAALAMNAQATRDVLAAAVERSTIFTAEAAAARSRDGPWTNGQSRRLTKAAADLAEKVSAIVGRTVRFPT